MQPISILFVFLFGSMILFAVTYASSINQQQEMAEIRLKRSLPNKRFYDFGARSINNHFNDDEVDEINDQYNRLRRFYDFGSKKRLARRFYDFGSKKK